MLGQDLPLPCWAVEDKEDVELIEKKEMSLKASTASSSTEASTEGSEESFVGRRSDPGRNKSRTRRAAESSFCISKGVTYPLTSKSSSPRQIAAHAS